MRPWITILTFILFSILTTTFPYYDSEKDSLEVFVNNLPYIVILIVLWKKLMQGKEIGYILVFMVFCAYYTAFDVWDHFKVPNQISTYEGNIIHYGFIFIYYLTFILLFKKRGAALYTGSPKDLYLGFSGGLFVFIAITFTFYGRLALSFEPLLLLFAGFKSYYTIVALNTPTRKVEKLILVAGTFLNFAAIFFAIYLIQAGDSSRYNHKIYTAIFRSGFFCLLYVALDLGSVIQSFNKANVS